MSSLVDIMAELAQTLQDAFDAIDLGGGITIQVAGRLNLNPSAPSIDIYPGDPFDDPSSRGFGQTGGTLIFTVRARVSTADSEGGQDFLLSLMDDESDLSVAATLEADQTLAGMASSVKVEGPSGYQQYADPGAKSGSNLLGCTWKVSVLRAFS